MITVENNKDLLKVLKGLKNKVSGFDTGYSFRCTKFILGKYIVDARIMRNGVDVKIGDPRKWGNGNFRQSCGGTILIKKFVEKGLGFRNHNERVPCDFCRSERSLWRVANIVPCVAHNHTLYTILKIQLSDIRDWEDKDKMLDICGDLLDRTRAYYVKERILCVP
jgi:hypothetical protein